jgi:Skp family chaperone for outer membrane proteins
MNKTRKFLLSAILIILSAVPLFSAQILLDKRSADTGSTAKVNVGYVDIEKIFKEHPMTLRLKNECLQKADDKKKILTDMQNAVKLMNDMIITSTTVMNQLKSDLEPKPEQITVVSTQTTAPVIEPVAVLQAPVSTNTVINLPGMTSYKTAKSTESAVSVSTATVKPVPSVIEKTAAIVQSTSTVKQLSDSEKKDKEAQLKEIDKWIENTKKEIEKAQNALITESVKDQDDICKMEEENTNKVLEDIYKVLERVAEDENISLIVDKNQILYGQSAKDLTDKVLERLRGR